MQILLADFEKAEIRVGIVVSAEKIPGKTKIIKLIVNVGDRTAQAVAGGAEIYQPDYFIGRRVIVVTNLEPRVIAGVRSEVMLLAADFEGKPVWLTVDTNVPPGTRVH